MFVKGDALVLKAFKFRIYPNQNQKTLIEKTFGSSRFVYNYFLSLANEEGYLSYSRYNKALTALKCENIFLKEVDKFALQNSLRILDDAYQRFFSKQNGRPKFKSKRTAKRRYRTNFTNNNIQVGEKFIKLPKLGKLKAKIHRDFNGRIVNATLSKTSTGKYFVSIAVEVEKPLSMEHVDKSVGVDLGLKKYVVCSDGKEIPNPRHFIKYEKDSATAQKKLSRKVKGSGNYRKQKLKIARIHEKIRNVREDFLHKLSYRLISENQVIAVESLKVKNMMRNKRLAKHISDASWSRFIDFLKYKSEWYGRTCVEVGTFYPSSQLCSCCGYVNKDVKDLGVRKWRCPVCESIHDRDLNAAKNITQILMQHTTLVLDILLEKYRKPVLKRSGLMFWQKFQSLSSEPDALCHH